VKARSKSKSNSNSLDENQSNLVKLCVERNFRALDLLQLNPTYATVVVPQIIDASNRQFDNIGLFTYLLWTGDTKWIHLLIPDDDSIDLATRYKLYDNLEKQFTKFIKSGVCFTLDGKKYTHQSQYSDAQHIGVLKEYIDKYAASSEEERKAQWINIVGGQQRLVELHIALALCHADHTPSHKLSIFSANEKQAKPVWFPLSESKLGQEYAICLSKVATACESPDPSLVKPMIAKLEAIEESKKNCLKVVKITLKELKENARKAILNEQLGGVSSKNN
jgi:hypothetical protein